MVIYYGIYDIYCVNLIRNEQELLAFLSILRYTNISVNMEILNCGYKLIIWLSVSTNHHKWLSTGVFLCTPVDGHFLR